MARTFTAVDLSRLPAPALIEALSYEQIYADMLVRLRELLPTFDAAVESDPAVKILQVAAYREFLLRARVNDAARAVMPAFAVGADLDQLAALLGIQRLVLVAEDLGTGAPAVMENDDDFRRRLVLAPEGFSVAGPEGAYIFHALSASPDVLDASVTSPSPGEVQVTVLPRNASVDPAVLVGTVAEYLSAEERRPLTDHVVVQPATVIEFEVLAYITIFPGPDSAIVMAEANRRLRSYLEGAYRLGRDIPKSGIIASLHVEGVQSVYMSVPEDDISIDPSTAATCFGINLIPAGTGE